MLAFGEMRDRGHLVPEYKGFLVIPLCGISGHLFTQRDEEIMTLSFQKSCGPVYVFPVVFLTD